MNRNKLIFFIVALVSIAIAWAILFSNGKSGGKETSGLTNGKKVILNIISKTGSSSGFFEEARIEFMNKNPNVEINYLGKSTSDAIDYINEDNDVDGWICADEAGADLLKDYYSKEHNNKNIVIDTCPIVITPLVFVGWEKRLNILGEINIESLYTLVSQGKTWQALGGQSNWGFFNFSHTDPVKSNSGMQFITLLINNFYTQNNMPKKELLVEDVANDKLFAYIKAFEKNTAKQADGSGTLIDSLIQYGPSVYDLTANYEFYALSNSKNAQGRWGNIKIVYPNPTIWSNRPFVLLGGKYSTKEKQTVCKKFKEFLLSPQIQQKAVIEGYRPANTAVSDLSYLEKEYTKYGFKKDIPPTISTPNIDIIQSIQSLIKRIQ